MAQDIGNGFTLGVPVGQDPEIAALFIAEGQFWVGMKAGTIPTQAVGQQQLGIQAGSVGDERRELASSPAQHITQRRFAFYVGWGGCRVHVALSLFNCSA